MISLFQFMIFHSWQEGPCTSRNPPGDRLLEMPPAHAFFAALLRRHFPSVPQKLLYSHTWGDRLQETGFPLRQDPSTCMAQHTCPQPPAQCGRERKLLTSRSSLYPPTHPDPATDHLKYRPVPRMSLLLHTCHSDLVPGLLVVLTAPPHTHHALAF